MAERLGGGGSDLKFSVRGSPSDCLLNWSCCLVMLKNVNWSPLASWDF